MPFEPSEALDFHVEDFCARLEDAGEPGGKEERADGGHSFTSVLLEAGGTAYYFTLIEFSGYSGRFAVAVMTCRRRPSRRSAPGSTRSPPRPRSRRSRRAPPRAGRPRKPASRAFLRLTSGAREGILQGDNGEDGVNPWIPAQRGARLVGARRGRGGRRPGAFRRRAGRRRALTAASGAGVSRAIWVVPRKADAFRPNFWGEEHLFVFPPEKVKGAIENNGMDRTQRTA